MYLWEYVTTEANTLSYCNEGHEQQLLMAFGSLVHTSLRQHSIFCVYYVLKFSSLEFNKQHKWRLSNPWQQNNLFNSFPSLFLCPSSIQLLHPHIPTNIPVILLQSNCTRGCNLQWPTQPTSTGWRKPGHPGGICAATRRTCKLLTDSTRGQDWTWATALPEGERVGNIFASPSDLSCT